MSTHQVNIRSTQNLLAKNRRNEQRAEKFNQFRKIETKIMTLKYLQFYDQQTRQRIQQSLKGQIPYPLPPLNKFTISYYRRKNHAVFKTHEDQKNDPHMLYQSLWILTQSEQSHYQNYQQIKKQFERDLQQYLTCQFQQIRQMAIIVSGNKTIGKQNDIIKLVKNDIKQLWVLINHIEDRKIPFTILFPYMQEDKQIVFGVIFEMSNYTNDDNIEQILKQQQVLQRIINGLNNKNQKIQKHCLGIIGNILAQKQQYVSILEDYNINDYFFNLLNSSNKQIRRDVCWSIANLTIEKSSATNVLYNQKLMSKLLTLIYNQTNCNLLIEMTHIFSNLILFGEKQYGFRLINEEKILERCNQFLQMHDQQLVTMTLCLIYHIIQLGDHFASDQPDEKQNLFCIRIKQGSLKDAIHMKTYSNCKEIRKLSLNIEQKLDQLQIN